MKKTNKIISILLVIAMMLTIAPLTVIPASAAPDTDYTGYYKITNAGNLAWFACLVVGDTSQPSITEAEPDAKAVLTADIDITVLAETLGKSWVGIGTEEIPFTGVFDGNGYTIKGLTTDTSLTKSSVATVAVDSEKQGLFGVIGEGGVVRDVIVEGTATLSDTIKYGGICSENNGTIENVLSMITVTGGDNADVFCHTNNGTITNSFADKASSVQSVTAVDADTLASGSVAYALGASFGQTIGTDTQPVHFNGENTVYKDGDVYTNTKPDIPDLGEARIYDTSVNLGIDLSVKFYVEIGEDIEIENIRLRTVSPSGVLKDLPVDTDGTGNPLTVTKGIHTLYVFTLNGITPQCIGNTIEAQLYHNDIIMDCDNSGLNTSIKEILIGIYDSSDDNTKQLIIDTLEYGAASQVYRDYKTDALVTDGFEPATQDVDKEVPENKPVLTDDSSAVDIFTNVSYGATNYLMFGLSGNVDFTGKVTVNDAPVTGTMQGSYYVVKTETISAKDLGKDFTVKYTGDDGAVTLTYSINDYCYTAYTTSTNQKMIDLAQALYNYGLSAHIYSGEHELGNEQTCMGYECEICRNWYGETDENKHTNYTYTASGNTITETCGLCKAYSGTLTISAPADLCVDGTTAKEAVVDNQLADTSVTYEVTYSTADGSAPKTAGTYTASVTLGDATASVEFTLLNYVASVTDKDGKLIGNYTTFADAITAARNSAGSTLTLLDNTEGVYAHIVSPVTLDLNGYTLDMGSNNILVGSVLTGYDPHVTLTDTSEAGTGKIKGSYFYGVFNVTYSDSPGKLTVQGGTIEYTGTQGAISLRQNGATVEMSGGSIKSTASTISIANYQEDFDGSVNISGGSFPDGLKILVNSTEYTSTVQYLADLLAEGYAFYNENGNKITVADDATEITGYVQVKEYFAASVTNKNGSTTNYKTLADAVTAAQGSEGSTLTLLDDITLTATQYINSGKFTLDLNGKTLFNETATTLRIESGADVTVKDSGEGGTVKSNAASSSAILNNGTLTVESGNIISENEAVENNRTLTVNGGSFEGKKYALYIPKGTTEIYGGEFNGVVWGFAPYTINDGDFTAGHIGINCEGGVLTVKGGTFDINEIKIYKGTVSLEGGEFKNGFTVYDLKYDSDAEKFAATILADGYIYNDEDGNLVTVADGVTKISGYIKVVKCSHNYEAVVTPPTCTEDGYTTYICICGDTYITDETPSLGGHTEGTFPEVPATCSETGFRPALGCTVCGEYLEEPEIIPALGHDIVADEAVPATCTETGLTEGSHCSRCDEATTAQETIPALGHDMVADEAVPATCTETGLAEGSHCSRCDEATTAQETIPALGHDMVADEAVEPTCTETGLTEGSHCSRCDDATTEQEEVPALGHDMVTDEAVEPTCTETGLTEGSHCSRCDDVTTEQEEVPAIGHDYDYDNGVLTRPTDSAKGYYTYTCKNDSNHTTTEEVESADYSEFDEAFGKVLGYLNGSDLTNEAKVEIYTAVQNYIANNPNFDSNGNLRRDLIESEQGVVDEATQVANGILAVIERNLANCEAGNHDVRTYTSDDNATCTEDGTKRGNCYVCGTEVVVTDENTPALGHDMITDEAVEPTCTETGLTEGSHCSRCDDATTAQETVPALGHDMVTDEAVPATCTETGLTEGSHCSRCDEATTAQEEVPALGHSPEDAVEENYVAPNCTENGSKDMVVYCAVCDEELERETETLDALGHTEEEIPAVEPTCTETGLTAGVKCSVCGETLTAQEEVPALGHDYESVVTEPTYAAQGYTTHTCAVCGDSYIDSYVDALGYADYFSIRIPSISKIRFKDTIVLHAEFDGELPEGAYVEWTADNENFITNELEDGQLEITSNQNGNTVFTATLYSADGTALASDTVEMNSFAGFFAKIGGFFRSLFGSTLYHRF